MTSTMDSTLPETATPVLEVEDLEMKFPLQSALFRRTIGWVQAVRGVSLTIRPGESLGIVGESGCGKSTLAETVVRLTTPTGGRIVFNGRDVTAAAGGELRRLRRDIQMVFQDPFQSLNPRMTVRQLIREPLRVHQIGTAEEQQARVEELCDAVGIDRALIDRRPTTFSGGQRQRIAIARALAPEPKLLVLDEPVSALDTSVQAQILNLLNDLRARMGISYIFIGHDLAVVRQVCDRIGVMYLGKLVELGEAETLLEAPAHPYTQSLLSAVKALEADGSIDLGENLPSSGEVPSPKNPPSGCGFRTRCAYATDKCASEIPELLGIGSFQEVSCHFPLINGSSKKIDAMDAVNRR